MGSGLVAALWAIGSHIVTQDATSLNDIRGIAYLGIVVGYVAALILGLPAYICLQYFHRASLTAYIIAGFVMGLLTFELTWPGGLHDLLPFWSAPDARIPWLPETLPYELVSGTAGLAAAALFWIIARPNHALEPPHSNSHVG